MNVQVAICHHVGAVALTGIEVVAQGVDERVYVVRGCQRTFHQLRTYFINVVRVIVVSVWRTQLHTGGRCALIGRVLCTAVGQLEVHTGINPLVNLVVDVGTQRVTVGAATLLPLVAVVGITYAEARTGLLITATEGDGVAVAPGG